MNLKTNRKKQQNISEDREQKINDNQHTLNYIYLELTCLS